MQGAVSSRTDMIELLEACQLKTTLESLTEDRRAIAYALINDKLAAIDADNISGNPMGFGI